MNATELNPKFGLGEKVKRVIKFIEDQYAISTNNGEWLATIARPIHEDLVDIYMVVEGHVDLATGLPPRTRG